MSDTYNKYAGKRLVMTYTLEQEYVKYISDGSTGVADAILSLTGEFLAHRPGINPGSVMFRIEE